MILLAVMTLVLAVEASSSSSTCVSSISVVPPSIEDALSSAAVYYPSVYTIGTILSTIELISPTFSTIESQVDYYIQSYRTMVTYLEEMYHSPWLDTDSTAFTRATHDFPTLAPDVSILVHMENTHTSLASIQDSLQSVMLTDPSILTNLQMYTEINYKSVYFATLAISQATLTNPSIVAEVIDLDTAIALYSTTAAAMSSLSSLLYTVASTIDEEVITFVESPSTVASTVVSTLEECYSTLYSDLNYIISLTSYEPSLVSDITGYVHAAHSVQYLGEAIYTIMSQQMPTLMYEASAIESIRETWPSFNTDLAFISEAEALSPSLYYAEDTIEATFYDSPGTAYSIYYALDYPSLVTDPSEISKYEVNHESFVSAVNDLLYWESYYTSEASTMHEIQSKLTSIFQTDRTLLTAASYMSVVISPSSASASKSIENAESVVSWLSTAMTEITYAISFIPSLSCDEEVIENDLILYTPTVHALWSAIYSPSSILSSSIRYYAEMEADYPSLVSAIESIISAVSSFPSLSTAEYAFIEAADSHSQLLTQWVGFAQQSSYVESAILTSSSSSFSS
jgi:hypothetical protein